LSRTAPVTYSFLCHAKCPVGARSSFLDELCAKHMDQTTALAQSSCLSFLKQGHSISHAPTSLLTRNYIILPLGVSSTFNIDKHADALTMSSLSIHPCQIRRALSSLESPPETHVLQRRPSWMTVRRRSRWRIRERVGSRRSSSQEGLI
jgi:hypothetical protein